MTCGSSRCCPRGGATWCASAADAPPEDCGGPWAFLELRQHYSVVTIADRLLALVSPLSADQHGDGLDPVDDAGDENGGRPLTVGLDGGYLHSSQQRSRRDGWFEVIAGKSMPTSQRS